MRKFALIVLGAVTFSCSDSSKSLVEQVKITPIVNPNVGILIKNNDLNAMLLDERTIYGTADGRVFKTTNFFQSFQVSPQNNHVTNIAFIENSLSSHAIVSYELPYKYYDPIYLYRSTDDGINWEKRQIPNISNNSPGGQILKMQFITPSWGFMLVDNWSYSVPSNALIFNVNMDKAEAKLISQFNGYRPVDMRFVDSNYGYVLLRSYLLQNNLLNTYVSRTVDGGFTWTTPTAIDVSNPLSNIQIIDQDKIIVFGHDLAYHSIDGGISWKKIIPNGSWGVNAMSFVNNSIGYAIDNGGFLSKSTDGGSTWTLIGGAVPPYVHLAVFQSVQFFNENLGIVQGQNYLYITKNGGKSWEALIYPFEYVTGQ